MSGITRSIAAGILSIAVASCSSTGGSSSSFTAPSPVASAAGVPLVFSEPGGFSTSDVYDAHGRIIQFTTTGYLVFTSDGTRIPGWSLGPDSYYWGPPTYFLGGTTCFEFCVFSIRFGSRDGQRRAFLTIDYGHYNPGTMVDVEVRNGQLVVTQTSLYPPGTPTLSGTVTEMTAQGVVPIAGASVWVVVPAGSQSGTADETGRYSIRGLIDGPTELLVAKPGYVNDSRKIVLNGDLRLDIQLTRQ